MGSNGFFIPNNESLQSLQLADFDSFFLLAEGHRKECKLVLTNTSSVQQTPETGKTSKREKHTVGLHSIGIKKILGNA